MRDNVRTLTIDEGTSGDFACVLRDEDGNALAQSSLTTCTMTLKNRAGTVINSRDAQDINNTNDVSIDSSGNFIWAIQIEDTTLGSTIPKGSYDIHQAVINYTWNSGTESAKLIVNLRVVNTE